MEHIMALLLLSIIGAMVGFGFARMMDPDMIFFWYRNWLEYLSGFRFKTFWYRIFEFKNRWNHTGVPEFLTFNLNKGRFITSSTTTSRRKSKFFYYITKPMGRCVICNTTWISMCLAFLLFRLQPLIVLDIITVGVAGAGFVVLIENKYHQLQNVL